MRAFAQIPLYLLAILLVGCAGYQKGALPDTRSATLYLMPVQNEAYLSGFASLFQSELRRQILASRMLKLVPSPEEADMIAYIRVADFEEQSIGFLESDTGQPISARMSIAGYLTLTETDAAETIIVEEKPFSVNSAVYSSPSTAFTNPVDQSKPSIARNLASKAVLEIELLRP